MQTPRERFLDIARKPSDEIDLGEAALVIAAEDYPDLEIGAYLRRLDGLAEQAHLICSPARTDDERVARLNRFLFVQQRFAGNQKQYYDRRNSFLNEVLDRRFGIPITLAIVYMEIARRIGWTVHGVSFPGHFLARYVGSKQIIVDPFVGHVVTESECRERLKATLGDGAEVDPNFLRAAGMKEILVRVLRNLKHVDVKRRQFERALAHCDRILLLSPNDPSELRDRGLVYHELECFGAAQADLEQFLHLAPDDETAAEMRETLIDVRRHAAMIQ